MTHCLVCTIDNSSSNRLKYNCISMVYLLYAINHLYELMKGGGVITCTCRNLYGLSEFVCSVEV